MQLPHLLPRLVRLCLLLGVLLTGTAWSPDSAAGPRVDVPLHTAVAAAEPASPQAPGISLDSTVGLDQDVCAVTDSVTLSTGGGLVTFCHEVTNTGDVALSRHDLVDNVSGTILFNFQYQLEPGASAFITASVYITKTTVNNAAWTAYNPGPTNDVYGLSTATVIVDEVLDCGLGPVTFESGLPPSWSVQDLSPGSAGIDWTTTADTAFCGIGNFTGGSGLAACADSDKAQQFAPPYDTVLETNEFDLPVGSTVTLRAALYYRDVGTGNDQFAIDLWNGKGWINELVWDQDHMPEAIAVDLSYYTGLEDLKLRFRYFGDGWDWYVEVDDVRLDCEVYSYLPIISR